MGTFYIIMILLMRVIQNYFTKRSSALFPDSIIGRVKYMAWLFAMSSLLAMVGLVTGGGIEHFDWITVGMATLSGITLVVAQLCMFLAMQSGTMVITSAFTTAGLIVPCVFGVLLFGETMTAWQWCGVAVFIAASFLLSASAKDQNNKFSGKTVLLLLGTFLANGGTMLCQKALTYINPTGSVTLFSFCSFAVPAVAFALYLMVAASKGITETLNRKIYMPIVLLAVALFLINQMVTEATKYVPSAILFTVPNGGNNVIAALLAALFFKEKMTVKSTIGLLLSIVSLVLVLGLVS